MITSKYILMSVEKTLINNFKTSYIKDTYCLFKQHNISIQSEKSGI